MRPTLFVYNPEHDTCLARNVDHFVVPAMALRMRREWGHYSGPFGIDMMVVRTTEGAKLNPCVEMNLRWTMGHAFL